MFVSCGSFKSVSVRSQMIFIYQYSSKSVSANLLLLDPPSGAGVLLNPVYYTRRCHQRWRQMQYGVKLESIIHDIRSLYHRAGAFAPLSTTNAIDLFVDYRSRIGCKSECSFFPVALYRRFHRASSVLRIGEDRRPPPPDEAPKFIAHFTSIRSVRSGRSLCNIFNCALFTVGRFSMPSA